MEPLAIGAIMGILTCAGCMFCILRKAIPSTLKVSRSSDHLSSMTEDEDPELFSSKPKSSATSLGS